MKVVTPQVLTSRSMVVCTWVEPEGNSAATSEKPASAGFFVGIYKTGLSGQSVDRRMRHAATR